MKRLAKDPGWLQTPDKVPWLCVVFAPTLPFEIQEAGFRAGSRLEGDRLGCSAPVSLF